MSLLDGLNSLSDQEEYVRAVLYGDPGTTKTTSAVKLATLGKIIAFPFEPGLKKTALRNQGVPVDNVGVMADDLTPDEIMKLYWEIKAQPDRFVGVVFDTMTALVRSERKRKASLLYERSKAQHDRAGTVYNKPRNWLPQEAYGEIADELGEIISAFYNLPMHLAYTAHIRRDSDDDGAVVYGPAVTPAVQSHLVGYADILMLVRRVGHYEDGSPIIIGTTDDGGKYQVKDRLGVLPSPHMALPTMDRIVAYSKGELDPKTDPVQLKFNSWMATAKSAARKETS